MEKITELKGVPENDAKLAIEKAMIRREAAASARPRQRRGMQSARELPPFHGEREAV